MSIKQTLSVMGMYDYDDTLLDTLVAALPTPDKIPTDYPDLYYPGLPIDADQFKINLILETAELEVLYADPDFLKLAIGAWANKEYQKWQLMYNTMYYKYNPIWNKDGTITYTETETRNLSVDIDRNNTRTENIDETTTQNLTQSNTGTTTRTDDLSEQTTNNLQRTDNLDRDMTTLTEVAGFNSESFVNANQSTESGTDDRTISDTGTVTRDNTGTVETENNLSQTNTGTVAREGDNTTTDSGGETRQDTGTVTREHETKETGNIGITMTQQMIDAERVTINYNVQDYIIQEFKKRFCLMIY